MEWIYRDLITNGMLTQSIRDGIKEGWSCDVLGIQAISEKLGMLNDEQRDALEYVIDQILAGESLIVEHKKQ